MYAFHAVHRLPFAILPNYGRDGGPVAFQSRYLGMQDVAGGKFSMEIHGIQATLIDRTRFAVDNLAQNTMTRDVLVLVYALFAFYNQDRVTWPGDVVCKQRPRAAHAEVKSI
jgi:hypothetical protein